MSGIAVVLMAGATTKLNSYTVAPELVDAGMPVLNMPRVKPPNVVPLVTVVYWMTSGWFPFEVHTATKHNCRAVGAQ